MSTNIIKTTIFSKNNSNWKRSINWGRKTIKIALAGVGSPEKLVSLTELRLNFASLYEEDIVIKNAETGNKEIIKLDELSITKEDEHIQISRKRKAKRSETKRSKKVGLVLRSSSAMFATR